MNSLVTFMRAFTLTIVLLGIASMVAPQDVRRRPIKAAAAAPTIVLVQQKAATAATGTDLGTALGALTSPVVAGNTIIITQSYLSTDSQLSIGMAIDGGGFDFVFASAISSTVAGATSQIWYFYITSGGTAIFDFSDMNVGTRSSCNVSEWSGLSNAAPEDTSTGSSVGSATMAVVPATLDPTSGNNLVIGVGGYANATSAYSSGPTASFVRGSATGGSAVFQEMAYLIRAGDHSAVTSDVTLGGSLAWASCAAAFGAP